MIYNVILASAAQQSDSVLYISMCIYTRVHVYTHILFQIPSHVSYYEILWAICMSSLEKRLFRSSAHLSGWVACSSDMELHELFIYFGN